MLDLKKLNKTDPVKRNVDKGLETIENSPMDPPSAYDESKKKPVDFENMAAALKRLVEEHKIGVKQIDAFEQSMRSFKENGYNITPEINTVFGEFFKYFDNQLMTHNQKEEKVLFPLLNQRLIESGEHSVGENPSTAIDVMEDDHIKFIQLGSLTFNMLGMATRIKDLEARQFVYDTAFNSSRELTELIRLHIYREDYTLFPLAQKLLNENELNEIENRFKKYA